MKVTEVAWTEQVNLMRVLCDCQMQFWARVDRWNTRCPQCGKVESTVELRDDYVRQK